MRESIEETVTTSEQIVAFLESFNDYYGKKENLAKIESIALLFHDRSGGKVYSNTMVTPLENVTKLVFATREANKITLILENKSGQTTYFDIIPPRIDSAVLGRLIDKNRVTERITFKVSYSEYMTFTVISKP